VPSEVEHQVIGLLDTNPEENPNAVLLLADLVDGIQALVDEGRRVFVHCVQAENRTPTVAAAWLHRHQGMSATESLDLVAERINRPKQFLADAVAAIGDVPR
jgi:protein-tyrosine phosphatase